jgi:hypothetical protein
MTTNFPRRMLATGAALLAIPALGGAAYAAAHAVSDYPAPQRVIPIDSRTHAADDSTATTDAPGREPEAGDDHVVDTGATTSTTSITHDANDDNGGATNVSDDGPNHDAGDDHGGTATTVTSAGDDHSGSDSGSGSDNSGSNSGSGSDDSGHHGADG